MRRKPTLFLDECFSVAESRRQVRKEGKMNGEMFKISQIRTFSIGSETAGTALFQQFQNSDRILGRF